MNKPYMQIPSDTLNLTGAQQFRVNMNIKSNTASIEQLNGPSGNLERGFRLHLIP